MEVAGEKVDNGRGGVDFCCIMDDHYALCVVGHSGVIVPLQLMTTTCIITLQTIRCVCMCVCVYT